LEQLDRRRAEAEVAARAEAVQRLQQVTASLSQAATTLDVSNLCLEHALDVIGAEAGFIVLVDRAGAASVEFATSSGYDEDELEAWRALGPDDDVPFLAGDGIGRAGVGADGRRDGGIHECERGTRGWVAVRYGRQRGSGALHLSFRTPTLSDPQREWLQDDGCAVCRLWNEAAWRGNRLRVVARSAFRA
jgi:hypothetical protein